MLYDYRSRPEFIPSDWSIESIRDNIVDIGDGGTPPRNDPSNFGGKIPWAVIEDIRKDMRETKENLSERGVLNSNAKIWPACSVIVSTGATIGLVGVARVPMATKQGITGIVPNRDLVLSDYLAAVLRYGARTMERYSQGSTFKEIRPPTLVRLLMLRPQVPEQRRIALVLDTIDDAIAKTEAVIAKLKQVRAGLLHDLLARGLDENGKLRDPIAHPERFKDSPAGRIPKEWQVGMLRGLVQEGRRITYGIVQPGEYDADGVLLIRGRDYIDGWQPVESYFKVSRALHNSYKRSLTRAGDILICIVGATTGAVNQVPQIIEEANITQTTARIACDERKFHSRFCLYVLASQIGQSQVRKYRKGSAQPGLNLQDVEIFQVPVPDVQEQKSISKMLDGQEQTIHSFEQELGKLTKLKSGLMSDLLTGRVRVPESVMAQLNNDEKDPDRMN
jgi:type I restriction enzyme S subunit